MQYSDDSDDMSVWKGTPGLVRFRIACTQSAQTANSTRIQSMVVHTTFAPADSAECGRGTTLGLALPTTPNPSMLKASAGLRGRVLVNRSNPFATEIAALAAVRGQKAQTPINPRTNHVHAPAMSDRSIPEHA